MSRYLQCDLMTKGRPTGSTYDDQIRFLLPKEHLHIERAANVFISKSWSLPSHVSMTAATTYVPVMSETIDITEGLITMVYVQAKRYAGIDPQMSFI